MNELNKIFVRRKNKYFLNVDPSQKINSTSDITERTKRLVGTLAKNIETKFGYKLSESFIATLLTLNEDEIKNVYDNLYTALNELNPMFIYSPLYPNFPRQVMELSEAELYTNAVMHYLGDVIGERIMPYYEKEERTPLLEDVNVKVIGLGTKEEFYVIFENLMKASSSISDIDREDIKYVLENRLEEYLQYYNLPESFNHKEIMAFVVTTLVNKGSVVRDYIISHIDNITDVLRVIEGLAKGDLSLTEKTKYKFRRKSRKFILSIIDEVIASNITSSQQALEDMYRHKNRWVKLGEVLHPGEFKNTFYYAFYLFDVLRNEKIETTNAKIDKLIKQDKILHLTRNVLTKRPGDFARRILHLLRIVNNRKLDSYGVIDDFKSVMDNVSTRVLLQLHGEAKALYSVNEGFIDKQFRIFVPKGNVAKAYVASDHRPTIDSGTLDYLGGRIEEVLIQRFGDLESLGKVYLDDNLKNYAVPMTQRSASDGIKTIPRFSKFDISDKNYIRFFIYWKDKQRQRVDIDLSSVFLDENLDLIDYVSYTNLRSRQVNCCHSGDITSAPNGASEFIDIDIDYAVRNNVRYVVPSIFNFTGDAFYDIPESSFGWMEREDINSGEIYEPTTVNNRINLTAEMQSAVPLVIDVVNREIIWCDFTMNLNIRSFSYSPYQSRALSYGINPTGRNIENNLNRVKSMLLGAINCQNKPDLYSLLFLHGFARGEFVDDPEEADIVFSEDNETQFNIDEILGSYLV